MLRDMQEQATSHNPANGRLMSDCSKVVRTAVKQSPATSMGMASSYWACALPTGMMPAVQKTGSIKRLTSDAVSLKAVEQHDSLLLPQVSQICAGHGHLL